MSLYRLLEGLHGLADRASITQGNGFFQRLRSCQHRFVMFRQGLRQRCRPVLGFALKRFVQRLPECVPQFLGELALDWHGLGLDLPTLLQGFDRIDAQRGRGSQLLGLLDQGAAQRNAVRLRFLPCRMGGLHGGLPLDPHVSEQFFAQVATVAPALSKLVQLSGLFFPVGVVHMGLRPGSHFGQQSQSLFAVC